MTLVLGWYNAQAQSISSSTFEVSTGASVNTRGGIPSGVNFQYLYYQNKYQQIGFRFDFVNVKHQKEVKYQLSNTGSFIYGKLNYLISLRPQFVYSKNLFIAGKENGVKINYRLLGGPSIGFVKPYYLEYYYESGNKIEPFSTTNSNPIVSSQGILYNMKEADKVLGVNVGATIDFELSQGKPIFWGLEIGFLAEYYPSGVYILPTENKNKIFPFLFLNLYGGIRK